MTIYPLAAGLIGGGLALRYTMRRMSSTNVTQGEQCEQPPVEQKYAYLHEGYLNDRNVKAKFRDDLKLGNFVRCMPGHPFKVPVILTGTTDPDACKGIKEHVLKFLNTAQASLDEAKREPITEENTYSEKEYVVGYYQFDRDQMKKPLESEAVYRVFKNDKPGHSHAQKAVKYSFAFAGVNKGNMNNPQAVKDLESGNFVRCPGDTDLPESVFKADLYITGITAHDKESACHQLRVEILKTVELATRCLVDANEEELGPNCSWEDRCDLVRYYEGNFTRAAEPLKTPTVYRASKSYK